MMARRSSGTAGQPHPWLRLAALALALTASSARAQVQGTGPMASPAAPTLVFLSSPHPGRDGHQEEGRQFGATVLRDLKGSGVFHLLDPKTVLGASDGSSFRTWRGAGAKFLLRFASGPMAQGKLLIDSECVNLETGAVVLKKTFVGGTSAVNQMAHRLADFMVGKFTGTPGIADSAIVFARATRPGIKEVFEVGPDGKGLRQLTAFGSLTIHPAVSADGRLAVVTYKGGPPQIWGQLKPGGPFVLMHPREGAPGLEISDLDWAPDGPRLCFVQGNRKGLSGIYGLDLRATRVARLTDEGHTSGKPCWNPSGTDIAFISDREGTAQVFLMASDGSQVRRLTGDPAPKECVAWNAQGDRIGYVARMDGQSALFTQTPAGTTRQQVATSAEPVESICWAPDGRWLLLGLKDRAGSRLRIASLDGKVQDLADGLGGGQFPQWTRNPGSPATLPSLNPFALSPVPALLGAATLP